MNAKVTGALESAIPAEIAAADLYGRLSDLSSSQETRRLFASLSADERRHRQLLEAQYSSIAGKPYEAQAVRRIRIPSGAADMLWPAALTLAINAEADAFVGYSRSATLETDPAARAMFSQLADDEAGHRRLLEAEYASRIGQPFSDYELESWVRE